MSTRLAWIASGAELIRSPPTSAELPWRRGHRRTVRWCRRFARRDGTARRPAGGWSHTRCPRRAPPSGCRPPSRPRHSWRSFRSAISGRCASTVRRKPCESCRSSGTSNVRRRPAKYSSISLATRSRRAGARRIRGLTSRARPSSTQSWSWLAYATRTRPCRGRGQQQRAHGCIDGAVGDVEQTRGVRGLHQAPVQPAVDLIVDRGQRGEQTSLVDLGAVFVPHRNSPFRYVFRKLAMPSAAARLAAS